MVVVAACLIVLVLMLLFFFGLRILQNNMGSSRFFKKFSGKSINVKEVSFIDPKNKIVLFQCNDIDYIALISPQSSCFSPHLKHFPHSYENIDVDE